MLRFVDNKLGSYMRREEFGGWPELVLVPLIPICLMSSLCHRKPQLGISPTSIQPVSLGTTAATLYPSVEFKRIV